MKTYRGRRTGAGVFVTTNGVPIDPRHDLHNHSPDGFEWGYGGSGPAQLALALLADHLGNDEDALAHYQAFKWAVVDKLPRRGWTLSGRDIDLAMQTIRHQPAAIGGAS